METFHLFHLAKSWPARSEQLSTTNSPVSSGPAALNIPQSELSAQQSIQRFPVDVAKSSPDGHTLRPPPRIRAASAQMVFAARNSCDFITPAQVKNLEEWSAHAVLEALAMFNINSEVE